MVIFLLPWQPNNGTLNNLPKKKKKKKKKKTFFRQNISLQQTNI